MIVNKKRAPETVPTPPTGYLTLFIRSDTGVPAIKNSDGVTTDLVIPGDASGVSFTPMDVLDWTDSVDPGNVDDALNDLARRMVAVEANSGGAGDASELAYTPTVAADWDGDVDPGDAQEALDQLAERVTDIEEAPGSGSSFGTIAVAGQDNVVADSSSDTLTFVAGSNITITTNAAGDSVTFTVSVDASGVTFTPSNSLNWTDSEDPGNVDDALDDLAARVQALEENPGGGGGSAFGTISVSGQSNVVADQENDTLTLVAGTNITITTNAATDAITITAASGSLSNWTEAVSTAAPNATVPVTSFTATNAAATVDAALIPKAGGAVLAAVPTSSSVGGNKRGSYAVDWQTSRSNAGEVASGTQSTVSGGHRNTSSGQYAAVGGGNINVASGTSATVVGGESNTASQTRSTVCGGASNTASGASSIVVGGFQNTADGDYSAVIGRGARSRGSYGVLAHSSGAVGGGDDQRREFMLYRGTSNATPAVMSADGAAASSTNTIVLPNNSLFAFQGHLVVRENATGDSKAIEFKGCIKRGANAASTALLGSVTQADLGTPDAGSATWTVAFTADTTLGGLAVTVTGEASHTLRWAASIRTTEVVN